MSTAMLKTAGIVTIVSALIWLYAESESVRTEEFRSVRVHFTVPPGSDRAVWLAADKTSAMSINITLEGPTAAIDALRQVLAKPLELSPGSTLRAEAGVQTVPFREALRRHPLLRRTPVTILDVSPPEVSVHVDDLIRAQLPVRVVLPPEFELSGPAQFSAAQATIVMPASLRDRVGETAFVSASIERERLERLTRDRLERITDVRLQAPANIRSEPFVRVEPADTVVSLTLKGQRVSVVLPTVFVELRIAPELLRNWIVEIPPEERFLRGVTVTGPADLVSQIERTGLVAYVRILSEDLERQIQSKEAAFSELPGSSLEFQVENRRVSLRIQRREAPVNPEVEEGPGS